MNEVTGSLLGIFGFLSQWLRARTWFAEWMLFAVAAFAGLLAMAKDSAPELGGPKGSGFVPILAWLADILMGLGSRIATFLGGTFTGHALSHVTGNVPKYNSEAPKGTKGSPGTPEHTAKEEYK